MTRVYVGIGSNIDRDANIRGGIAALKKQFGDVTVSRVYESPAYGFEGDNFYNLVAGFDTEFSLNELAEKLRAIEYSFGRKREHQRFLSRTLDIDILLYGDLVCHDEEHDLPREDIKIYAFVLCPLAEIAGQVRHPELGKSYSELWSSFDKNEQQIWPASLSLTGSI
jgi:2-amino-4-hydroxy-6-hydroxymethyldihydropteridine diphosphokinase